MIEIQKVEDAQMQKIGNSDSGLIWSTDWSEKVQTLLILQKLKNAAGLIKQINLY